MDEPRFQLPGLGAAAHPARAAQGGFTLAEMLAALGILLLGITALIGALSSTIAQRRTTDARLAAAALCEEALHRLQTEAVRVADKGESTLDLELATLPEQTAPGFPGMTWTARAIGDPNRPDVWLIELQVHWLEVGEPSVETFWRVLPRQLPFGERVRRAREELGQTTR